jgi:CBS domain-containing protein
MREPHMQISELQLLKDLKIKHVIVDTEEGSSIDRKSTITEALSLMAKDPNNAVVITVENGDIIGIATEKDVILALEKFGPSILDRAIETIMTSDRVRSDFEITYVLIQKPDRAADIIDLKYFLNLMGQLDSLKKLSN